VKNLPFIIYHLSFYLSISKFSNQKIRWKMEDVRWKIQRGQSLFEVVVAIAISAIIIVTIVALVTNSIRNSTFSKNQSLASNYAQQATEWLRGKRDEDVTQFVAKTGTSTTWCLDSLPDDLAAVRATACSEDDVITNTNFIREVKFATTTSTGKTLIEADVAVSWDDSQGNHKVTSATSFADWRQR
jgi:Tfp pilus assembly protein PilV